jgi:hypothetical protein
VSLPGNAGRTGTSQRLSSKRHGSKAAKNFSIRTAKRTSNLSVSRMRNCITDFGGYDVEGRLVACGVSGGEAVLCRDS